MKKIIIILIIIILVAVIYFWQKSETNNSINNETSFNNIEDFVASYELPEVYLSTFLEDTENDLKFFQISYGEREEWSCSSWGCIKPHVDQGIKYKDKIGFIETDTDYALIYDINSSDSYLYSEELFSLLSSRDEENKGNFLNFYLRFLEKDSDVPQSALSLGQSMVRQ